MMVLVNKLLNVFTVGDMKKTEQKTRKYLPEKAGKIIIDGVNPYDYSWEYTGRKAWIQDPIYEQNFSFAIFKINSNGHNRDVSALDEVFRYALKYEN